MLSRDLYAVRLHMFCFANDRVDTIFARSNKSSLQLLLFLLFYIQLSNCNNGYIDNDDDDDEKQERREREREKIKTDGWIVALHYSPQ